MTKEKVVSYKTKDFKITFLGVTPVLNDETGYLKPQDIVALSALMTFKGKSVKDLYTDAVEKGQNIENKVKTIHRKSSLRGHASMATTPAISFNYEASKFIDSIFTGMVFSSSFMASGRRTDTSIDEIVYPTKIDQDKEAKKIYKEAAEANINFLNLAISQGIEKDEASKVLQYGIYGTGTISYPIESIVAMKKEIELEGKWMPEEAKLFVAAIEKELKKMGMELIYSARDLAARNTLPFPNIFKDPDKSNIARELINQKELPNDLNRIQDFSLTKVSGLEKKAAEINKLASLIYKEKKNIKKQWRDILVARADLLRDYGTVLNLKMLSSVSWRVWGEKKRHRTVQMTPDSVYYAIDRANKIFEKFIKKITSRKLTSLEIKKIDRVFTVPPALRQNKDLLYGYLDCVKKSLETYYELIEKYKIDPSDAIYLMPRGVRIDLFQNYDLFNLVSGYYPLRTCTTAETQLRAITRQEMIKIKQFLEKKNLKNTAKLMVTKCWIPGFCLEEKNCPVIQGLIKDYDEKFHEEMKEKLDEEYEDRLKNLGK